MHTTMIRPGLLVSLKTTLRGGVTYQKRTIDPEHAVGAALVETWETTREVADAEDHARAIVARGKCRSLVTGVCCSSSFGLLCPVEREDKLAAAIEEAYATAEAHNKTSTYSRIDVFVIAGRIADNDVQAARAIGDEVRDLLTRMETAVRAADPEAIRDAANRARSLSGMLGESTQAKVTAAIAEVRKIARDMVKRAGEAGETAAQAAADIQLQALESARFAVLDLTTELSVDADAAPAPQRALDFDAPAANDEPAELAAAPVVDLE